MRPSLGLAAALSTLRGWRYVPAGSRDLRLDFLRGYLVFAMVVDHIGKGSWLHALTGGDKFVVSAAEGFIFVSGLVMGMVYQRIILRAGLRVALLKAFARGVKLYFVYVGLTLSFVAASSLTGAFWFVPIEDDVGYVVDVLTLRQTYYLTDIIQLYTLLFLATPLALLLLARGRTLPLLLGSAMLWAVYQQYPWELTAITGNVAFPAAAWQIFFFSGLLFGYHRPRIRHLLGRVPLTMVTPILLIAAIALFAQHLSGNSLFMTEGWAGRSYSDIFFKWDVRPGRLLAAAVFFPLVYLLVTAAWRPALAGLGWILLPLGQNSLLAYSVHLAVVLAASTLQSMVPALEDAHPAINSALQLAGVALLWGFVRSCVPAPAGLRQPFRGVALDLNRRRRVIAQQTEPRKL